MSNFSHLIGVEPYAIPRDKRPKSAFGRKLMCAAHAPDDVDFIATVTMQSTQDGKEKEISTQLTEKDLKRLSEWATQELGFLEQIRVEGSE